MLVDGAGDFGFSAFYDVAALEDCLEADVLEGQVVGAEVLRVLREVVSE